MEVIGELVACVREALGHSALAGATCDTDADGTVVIDELLAAVGRALDHRSSVPPTPTPTPLAMLDPGEATSSDAMRSSCGGIDAPVCAPQLAATPRPCGAVVLSGGTEPATTVGGSDALGGVNCGTRGGGTGAPERVFEFVALSMATYEISVQGVSPFTPLLHLRRDSCTGSFIQCAVDRSRRQPSIELELSAGERVAIIVDGDGAGVSGAFMLRIHKRAPDLVVTELTAPSTGAGGALEPVAAEVANLGDAPAEPFTVEIGYARDAELNQPLGGTTVTCDFDGLAPNERRRCEPQRALPVPLVKPQSYVVGATVDAGDAVVESDEGNNRRSQPITITVNGVELVHRLYRSRGGTSYQLLYARPTFSPSQEESYLVTSIAGSETGASGCMSVGAVPGSPVSAIAGVRSGTSSLYDYRFARRTTVFEPSDVQVQFSPTNAGVLALGNAESAARVCPVDGFCPGRLGLGGLNPLQSLIPSAPEVLDDPHAWVACITGQQNAQCDGAETRATWLFGAAQAFGNEPLCAAVSLDTTVCGTPSADGIPLGAGEAIVFVYGGSYDTSNGLELGGSLFSAGFSVSAAGFAIDEDGANVAGCDGGVLTAFMEQAGYPAADPPPTPLPVAPANDTCETAILMGPPFATVVNMTLATRSDGDPPTCFPVAPEVDARNIWFAQFAPFSFRLRFEALGEDATVRAFVGFSCGALQPLPCNVFESETVDIFLDQGNVYYFMVNARGGNVAVRATAFF